MSAGWIVIIVVVCIIIFLVGLYFYVGACAVHQAEVEYGLTEKKWYYMELSENAIKYYKKIRWAISYYPSKWSA
jgi:hypothetical protein